MNALSGAEWAFHKRPKLFTLVNQFKKLIINLSLGVIMVLLNISFGLQLLVEHPFCLIFTLICCCLLRCCILNLDDKLVSLYHNTNNINDLKGLNSLNQKEKRECDKNEGNDLMGSTDDINELTKLLENNIIIDTIINKKDLEAKMNEIPHRFCFLKCLQKSDKEAFIKEYITLLNSDKAQLKYYESGVIKVSTWLSIMRRIELQNCYRVYRDAYWGENTGKKEVSSTKVILKSMLVEFGTDHIDTIDLLIANRHITKIYFFRRSNFVNVKQWFWDNIIGCDD